jgi:SAM-dependent methyltransferase
MQLGCESGYAHAIPAAPPAICAAHTSSPRPRASRTAGVARHAPSHHSVERSLGHGTRYADRPPLHRAFLDAHRDDIRGHALEVKDSGYVDMFGAAVTRVDVLDIDRTNSAATIVADLCSADAVPSDEFDCIVLTQTLQFIFDVTAAIRHLHRMLRPGGVLLTTVPSIIRSDRVLGNQDYWRFTTTTCRRLFGETFGDQYVDVGSFGNVLAAVAFLMGMAREELSRGELDTHDDRFPVLITVRAVKAAGHTT